MAVIAIDARKIKSSTGRYVLELLQHLEKIDTTNTYKVIVLPNDSGYYTPTNPNFEVIVADFPHYSFAEQIGFNKFLRSLHANLVHFYMPKQPLLYTLPAVTTVHDLNLVRVTENDMHPIELLIKKNIFKFLLNRVAHRTKHIITPTKFTKDDLVSWARISPDKVTVTYEGVTPVEKATPVEGYENVPFLVHLGRAEPYKNNRRMIEAHQKLIRTKPELRLVIIGALDELRQADITWVKENDYKNVDFLGWRTDEEAAWLYQRAIAYIAPSYMEGFGLPALEALTQGLPVISADTTCCPEVLGDAAHYFDPFDVDDIARAINDVMTNANLRDRLAARAKPQTEKYSWRKMAEQTLEIYNNTLNRR
jgi:glycosyltransferase involved in cell wall biosynthesis